MQRPRISHVPPYVSSAGQEAVELAAAAGLHLDPWQQFVLTESLGERADGKWSAFEVASVVPRQNGKGALIEARELAGLFLFGERLILHSAHEFKTAQEAFRRILWLVENCDALRKRVARIPKSNGEEGIELRSGARLRFVARSTGSGRGFSGDLVVLDEAYNLSTAGMAALLPTLSARPNPQIWYTSSAPLATAESDQLRRVCRRGREGNSPRLAYFEFSAEEDTDLDDRQAWAMANPALGIRIDAEFIAGEREALPDEDFARERLGVFADDVRGSVIPLGLWSELTDEASQITGRMVFAIDVPPDRSATAISSAGAREDGLVHVEVVDHRPGTGWAPDRMADLVERWNPAAVVLDAAGPAAALVPALRERGVEPVELSAREMAQACGGFYDMSKNRRLRHLGQRVLTTALGSAQKRPLGDAWAWGRKVSAVDISPLVSVTEAAYGFAVHGNEEGVDAWFAYVG